MKRYDAEPHLRGLTDFQLASVDHVIEQFYGPVGGKRFLVADETGLGKTRVAQASSPARSRRSRTSLRSSGSMLSTSAQTRTSPSRTSAGST